MIISSLPSDHMCALVFVYIEYVWGGGNEGRRERGREKGREREREEERERGGGGGRERRESENTFVQNFIIILSYPFQIVQSGYYIQRANPPRYR